MEHVSDLHVSVRHECVVGCQQLRLGLLLSLSKTVGWMGALQDGHVPSRRNACPPAHTMVTSMYSKVEEMSMSFHCFLSIGKKKPSKLNLLFKETNVAGK